MNRNRPNRPFLTRFSTSFGHPLWHLLCTPGIPRAGLPATRRSAQRIGDEPKEEGDEVDDCALLGSMYFAGVVTVQTRTTETKKSVEITAYCLAPSPTIAGTAQS